MILVIRFAVGIALLAGAIAITEPAKLTMGRRAIFLTLFAGLVNGIGILSFYASLSFISGSLATMIFAVNPLFILAALALFAGESLTGRHVVRLLLGISGAYLLIGQGPQAINFSGVALVVTGMICITIEMFFLQQYLRDEDSRTVTLYLLIAMWISIIIGSFFQETTWAAFTFPVLAGIGVMALFGTFLGWWLMFRSIHDIGSGQYALLSPLETVLSVAWLTIFVGESLTPPQYAGGALILTSALLASRGQRRRWISARKPTLR